MRTTLPGFIGIDLAWGPKARTGLAIVDDAGRLVRSGAVRTDDEIHDWIATYGGDVVVVAVDAPLIVPNETGQRRCETEISRAFWRQKIGAHSSNKGRAHFNPPRAATLARRFGWSVDPAWHGSAETPVCIEVYPHPAMVGLFGLPERIAYKSGPLRAEGFAQLIQHFTSIDELRLSEHPRWAELSAIVADPGPGDLTRIEDELDAILCAHLGWLWHHRPEGLKVYGSLEDGYIVAPPAPPITAEPEPETPSPTEATSTPLNAMAVDIAGRPTGSAAGDDKRWKTAVRSAFAGKSMPTSSRVAIEVEYRLDDHHMGPNAPGLYDLLKATIDAMDEVLGLRAGGTSRPLTDDVRVDRIVASKRAAKPGEMPGARVVIAEL